MTDPTDLTARLRRRAGFAREEGNVTAISDALHFEEAVDAIASLIAERDALRARTVKPLVWRKVTDWRVCTKHEASGLGGEFMVVELDPGEFSAGFDIGGLAFRFVLAEYDDGHGYIYSAPAKYSSVDEAKAAAQADYERRILSAITANEGRG